VVDPSATATNLAPTLRRNASEIDRLARFPKENLNALRESGLLGLLVPRRDGGLGGNLADLVEVAGILAGGCLSTALIWAMHCQQVDVVLRFGSSELREKLVPRIAGGESYLASVTSGRGTGGHLLTSEEALKPTRDGWHLDRDAPVVTGGLEADGYLVTMRADPEASDKEITLVYLDRSAVEVVRRGVWDPMGMRGAESPAIQLRGEVRRWQVVGEAGSFRDIATESVIPLAHIGWSACWLGAAREAFRSVIALYGHRDAPRTFDVRSDSFTARLGRIRIDLELIGAYLQLCVAEVENFRSNNDGMANASTQVHLNTLKVVASELSFRVVDHLIELVGLRLGYQRDSPLPLERLFRDLRAASLNYGNDRLLTAIGRLCLVDRAVTIAD
jgi:acyl-CoA dehydrogenase